MLKYNIMGNYTMKRNIFEQIYAQKYITYKRMYKRLNLKLHGGDGDAPSSIKYTDIILITGRGGVGKSTVAKKFNKEGYYLLSLDQIIMNRIVKEFGSYFENYDVFFWMYVQGFPSMYEDSIHTKEQEIYLRAKKRFIEIIKKKMEKHKKIVIEGGLKDRTMIEDIFKNRLYTFLYVQPSSVETYETMIINRFVSDPDRYGRLGYLKKADDQNIGLILYKKGDDSVMNKIIKHVAAEQYDLIETLRKSYEKYFKVDIFINDGLNSNDD
jgi:hypothetical protein